MAEITTEEKFEDFATRATTGATSVNLSEFSLEGAVMQVVGLLRTDFEKNGRISLADIRRNTQAFLHDERCSSNPTKDYGPLSNAVIGHFRAVTQPTRAHAT